MALLVLGVCWEQLTVFSTPGCASQNTFSLACSFWSVFCCRKCCSVYTLFLLMWYLSKYIFVKFKRLIHCHLLHHSALCLLPLPILALWTAFGSRKRGKSSLLLIPVAFIYLQLLTRALGTRFLISVRAVALPLRSQVCLESLLTHYFR